MVSQRSLMNVFALQAMLDRELRPHGPGGTLDEFKVEEASGIYYLVGKGETPMEAVSRWRGDSSRQGRSSRGRESGTTRLAVGTTTHFSSGSPCSVCEFVGDVFADEIAGW